LVPYTSEILNSRRKLVEEHRPSRKMAIVEYESRRRRIVRMNSRIREFQFVGKEFLSSTSMHGLQYIAEEKRSIVER